MRGICFTFLVVLTSVQARGNGSRRTSYTFNYTRENVCRFYLNIFCFFFGSILIHQDTLYSNIQENIIFE